MYRESKKKSSLIFSGLMGELEEKRKGLEFTQNRLFFLSKTNTMKKEQKMTMETKPRW